jgi:hypothetical protein
VTVRLFRLTRPPRPIDFRGVPLGNEPFWGVDEAGFYAPNYAGGRPRRWTNGAARLVVPLDPQDRPGALLLDLEAGPAGCDLTVRVNGRVLVHEALPPGPWSKAVDLADLDRGRDLTLELLSDTFVPHELDPASGDERPLGLLVKEVRLLAPKAGGTPAS